MASLKFLLFYAAIICISSVNLLSAEVQARDPGILSSSTNSTLSAEELQEGCGGFELSCYGISSKLLGVLEARCNARSAFQRESYLDLNTKLGNDDGKLVKGSGFTGTCKDTQISPSASDHTVIYSAQCANRKGVYKKTQVDLNKVVSNEDGVLFWDDRCNLESVITRVNTTSIASSSLTATA